MNIGGRQIGPDDPPLVIAECGLNHAGSIDVALEMVREAYRVGCECVKFQTHAIDEFSDTPAYPGNAGEESIQSLVRRCSLDEDEEFQVKAHAEALGMMYLSTPFSVQAVDRLERAGVRAYKIGSGSLTDLPLVSYIASKGKPVILSTGMGSITDVHHAVVAMEVHEVPYALMACTSLYPTPYKDVRLGTVTQLAQTFTAMAVGLSCHSVGIWTALGAVALGASIVEKHFKIDSCPPGPDLEVSISPGELADLVRGSRAIWEARGGTKEILPGERETLAWFKRSRRNA